MTSGVLRIGRVFGVPLGLHYTWVAIAVLIALSLAGRFQLEHPTWSTGLVWTVALVTGALFFTGLVLHELAHAVAAKASGLPVRSITLFALGGLAHIQKQPPTPKAEFTMAIAGPLTSVALGAACLAVALGLGWAPGREPDTPVRAVLVWLGYINVVLAVFNMVPGYPLDGGRVLRAAAWAVTGDRNRATKIAARGGQVVALLLIGYGLFTLLGGAGFGGLWLAFIGWFLLVSAHQAYAESELDAQLRDVRVGDIMSADCRALDERTTVREFIEEYLFKTGRRCFIVEHDGTVAGLVTPSDVRGVAPERWQTLFLRDVMRPLPTIRTIGADAPVTQALEAMSDEDLNQLPVVSDGTVMGTISRSDVLRLLRTRNELHLAATGHAH
jgi:Zn-dependent protease/CBS domain-containing protein